jgi:hypothetical protein
MLHDRYMKSIQNFIQKTWRKTTMCVQVSIIPNLKSTVFWVVKPCSHGKARCLHGTQRLHASFCSVAHLSTQPCMQTYVPDHFFIQYIHNATSVSAAFETRRREQVCCLARLSAAGSSPWPSRCFTLREMQGRASSDPLLTSLLPTDRVE